MAEAQLSQETGTLSCGPNQVRPVKKGRHHPFSSEEAASFLQAANEKETSSVVPFKPHGGEVYLFSPRTPRQKDDHKADGYRWRFDNRIALPRKSPLVQKTYFYGMNRGAIINRGFKKHVYQLYASDSVFLIHYLGDEKTVDNFAHGNASRQTKLYVRTKPSVLQDIKARVTTEEAGKIYKDMVADPDMDGHAATSKPRNPKQVQNFREKERELTRATRDSFANVYEYAIECGDFVHYMALLPDLTIVAGSEKMLDEFQKVIQCGEPGQLVSYDTTFNLGPVYLSCLLFRHTLFSEKPVMLVAVLLHERKTQSAHEIFFNYIQSRVRGLKGMPIVTDEEAAIVNAITKRTDLVRLGCRRHLIGDIKRWVDSHGGTKDDRAVYVAHVSELLDAKSEAIFEKKYLVIRQKWSKPFLEYFETYIVKNINSFGSWIPSIKQVTRDLDLDFGVTTNQSEGFNFLLKDLQAWNELPIDKMLHGIHMLQNFYLQEINRGYAGLGTYDLRESCSKYKIAVEELVSVAVCNPKDIVACLKENSFKEHNFGEDKHLMHITGNTKICRAHEILAANKIEWSSKFKVFLVQSTNGKDVYTVHLFPKSTCTCLAAAECCHILAVQLALKMPVQGKQIAKKYNMTVLHSRKRKQNKLPKAGRKWLQDADVIAASDAIDNTSDIADSLSACDLDRTSNKRSHNQVGLGLHNEPTMLSEGDMAARNDVELIVDDDMWLISKDGVVLNMEAENWGRLDGTHDNGWLNDKIIDAAHALLRQKYPDIGGMQSCLLAQRPSFRVEFRPFIQIINTRPRGSGLHWILLSTIKCPPYTVDIYDSTNCKCLTTDNEFSVAKLMHIPDTETNITVRFKNSPNQLNGRDCGVYAIANMISILNGIDPSNIKKFDASSQRLRDLLRDQFRSGKLCPLPSIMSDSRSLGYTHLYNIPIFCSCRMPDLGYYFTCDICLKWYHPKCQGINVTNAVLKKKNTKAYCLNCHKGPGPRVVESTKRRK